MQVLSAHSGCDAAAWAHQLASAAIKEGRAWDAAYLLSTADSLGAVVGPSEVDTMGQALAASGLWAGVSVSALYRPAL